jgi:hypothetical protein
LGRGGRSSSGSASGDDSEAEGSLEAAPLSHNSGDEHPSSSTCTVTIPEFAWQEEPRPPPSRLSFYEPVEPNDTWYDTDEFKDDAASIYSQFSSAYTFHSRSRSIRGTRSIRRNGKPGRMRRRMTATSMMSVYSQASFSSQDAMDLPPMPSVPWGLKGDPIGGAVAESAENDLGEMTFNEPEYAYAYSLDEYVGHGLEGAALAGRTAARSGADFEAALPLASYTPTEAGSSDDWRTLLTAQEKGKGKRRTSSNISVVETVFASCNNPRFITGPAAISDAGSQTTNGSIGDISTTSTLTPTSPGAFVPNRRQRTVRRVVPSLPSSPRSNYQPQSPTSVVFEETRNGGLREVSSDGDLHSASPGPEKTTKKAGTRGVRSGLRGMRSRVNGLKSLVSLTLAPRSPSSPSFSEFYNQPAINPHLPPNPPTTPSHWLSSGSPSVSSSSSSSRGSASMVTSSASSWTPGLTHGDFLFLSPTAAPATVSVAI